MEPQTANFVVKYARKETNVTVLHGAVACELSTSNYGKRARTSGGCSCARAERACEQMAGPAWEVRSSIGSLCHRAG